VWEFKSGGGWDHPIHVHFEEGLILSRNRSTNIPASLKGRKDVFRLGPGGEMKVSYQFRDFGGTFVEHCHTTSHEDHAMLLRWDLSTGSSPFLTPLPTPLPRPQGVSFITPPEVFN
jgi:manganese oxidase